MNWELFYLLYGILVALLVQTFYDSLGEWMSGRLKPKYRWFAKFGGGLLLSAVFGILLEIIILSS
jgi:hypothetical protein